MSVPRRFSRDQRLRILAGIVSIVVLIVVLQLWLLKAQRDLLVAFLDGVGIAHDGDGAADDLPDEIDPAKLKATVESLLAGNDPELVRAYLHTFHLQQAGGWDEIRDPIESEPRLQFPGATAATAPAPSAAAEE